MIYPRERNINLAQGGGDIENIFTKFNLFISLFFQYEFSKLSNISFEIQKLSFVLIYLIYT